MKVYKSKVDLWLILILTFSIGLCAWEAWGLIANSSFVLASFLFVIGVGLPLWLLIGTKYIVADNELKIVCGPFRWKIEISSITKVTNSRSLSSSPALSLDRLEIEFESGKRVLVSPKNRGDFLVAINQV
ncbi:MAG: PH domain-containing protein [Alteromonadales bacterium]|nr:PH domain-containing protein [Alteromonadales bacterium]